MYENKWNELQGDNRLIPLSATPPEFEAHHVARLFNDAHSVASGTGVVCALLRNSASATANSGEQALTAATIDGLLQLVEVAARQLARALDAVALERGTRP